MDGSDFIWIAEKTNIVREKIRQKDVISFSVSQCSSMLNENILCHIFNLNMFLSFSAPKYFHLKG